MATETQPANSRAMLWTGYVLSALPALAFLASGIMKFVMRSEDMTRELEKIGWHESQLVGLGILEVACTIIYAIPQTAVLGAVLLTGYLGGAIATHVRIGDHMIAAHIILGMLVWGGLWLRDPRLRKLLPIRW